MRRRLTAALVLLQPALSVAQVIPGSGSDSTAFVLQVKRPFHLAAGDRVGDLLIVGDTGVIDGTVSDQLIVINGTAFVRGTVRRNVIVVRGQLELASSARVGRDVLLYRSALTRAPGAAVGGTVHERTAGFTFSERAPVFSPEHFFAVFTAYNVAVWPAQRLGMGLALVRNSVMTPPGERHAPIS